MSVSRPGGKKGDEEEDWRGTEEEEAGAVAWVCDGSPSAAKVREVGLGEGWWEEEFSHLHGGRNLNYFLLVEGSFLFGM